MFLKPDYISGVEYAKQIGVSYRKICYHKKRILEHIKELLGPEVDEYFK